MTVIQAVEGQSPEMYNDLAAKVQQETNAEGVLQIILNGNHGTGVSVLSGTYMQRRTLQDVLSFALNRLKSKCDEELSAAEAFAAQHIEGYVAKHGEAFRDKIAGALEFKVLVGAENLDLDTYIDEVVNRSVEQATEQVVAESQAKAE